MCGSTLPHGKEKMKRKITKIIIALTLAATTILSLGLAASANENAVTEEDVAEYSTNNISASDGESGNIFAEMYAVAEENADKIFSALAFIGTLIVGATYKSGLLPLLSDALSKLKGTLDGIKTENEKYESLSGERISSINSSIDQIAKTIDSAVEKIRDIDERLAEYELTLGERESMKTILEGQIDMLYSIFMTSALPQFEKEEIGNRIARMREELNSYESSK